MKRYNPKEIEPKWQKKWLDDKTFQVTADQNKPKKYIIDMFPYPSGAAMHVGHVRNFTISDVLSQYHRQKGYNVMHTMGWDTFGLPAENYAIKTGTSPVESTKSNIANFKRQLQNMGMSYDWSREINTTDPKYYKWTQWIFTKLFENGLAYQKESAQWWCSIDKTVLANEQVIDGKCWRHDGPDDPPVVKKNLKQWFFKITDYADQLLDGIDDLDWPDKIKTMQRNWIGKSKGAEIKFKVVRADNHSSDEHEEDLKHGASGTKKYSEVSTGESDAVIAESVDGVADRVGEQDDTPMFVRVFTTRADTLFGASFLVLAPEHELVAQITTQKQKAEVDEYVKQTMAKSELDRQAGKEKTGVFTGAYAINPVNDEKIPIWIADYVLTGYGTGAIMAVPAHDERDNEFAQKLDLQIVPVVVEKNGERHSKGEFRPIAISIIVNEKGEVLIQSQDRGDGETYSLPGGGIDEWETAKQAALRESEEETGYFDFGKIVPVGTVEANYFNKIRQVYRQALATCFIIYLNSEKKNKQNFTELEKKVSINNFWVSKEKALELLTGERANSGEDAILYKRYLTGELDTPYSGEGVMINSGKYDGMDSSEAREKIVADLAEKGVAQEKVNYKMRDWLISRQRYWGAPIPIIHCPQCGPVAVPEKDLPIVLPEVDSYEPTGEGSVLAGVADWVNTTCPKCGGEAKRETDTMDGYACSSWYFLRYTDPNNDKQAWDPAKANYWLPIDYYCGGDHAVSHLLYSRFWMYFFADQGLIDKIRREPVGKLVYNGYILAEDGNKMSKSKGNTVNPDELIEQGYGADSVRLFEMFIAPYEQNTNWNTRGVPGTFRFLQRFWTLVQEFLDSGDLDNDENDDVLRATHLVIMQTSHDLDRLSFNTAVASLMSAVNSLYKIKAESNFAGSKSWQSALESITQLLAPFAPHIAEELWQELGQTGSVHVANWPEYDGKYLVSDSMNIVVQINGKLRANIEVASDASKDEIIEKAQRNEKVANHLAGDPVKKSIYVPNKLVNFVV